MPAEQPLFNLRVTSEFRPARGPRWIPEKLRSFFSNFREPEEIITEWDGLTLDIAKERRDQARTKPDTKEVVIFLAE